MLLPVLASVWRWPPPAPSSPAPAAAGSSACRLHGALQRATAAVHSMLRLVAAADAKPLVRALAWWWLLTNCWLLCKLGVRL